MAETKPLPRVLIFSTPAYSLCNMAKKINLQPMDTRAPIYPLNQESKTASGLLLSETAKDCRPV